MEDTSSWQDWSSEDSGPSGDAGNGNCIDSLQFACFTGECILQSWVCDGMEDCEYGEDEYECPGSNDEHDGY